MSTNEPLAPDTAHRIWPAALLICGVALSAVWGSLLGYGLARLMLWLLRAG